MASVQQTLRNPSYRNWVKGGLVLKFTKDGIQCFVDDAAQRFQQKCLNHIWARKCLTVGTVCNLCTTQNVLPCPTRGTCIVKRGVCNYHDNNDPLKTHIPCPSGICNDLRNEIAKSHRFHGPSWRNTNAQLWCSNSWQIAKCFMAADGYSSVTSAAETDFPGLVSVVINLNDVQNMVKDDLSKSNNLFSQARTIRNDILHTASFELTDMVLNDYIDTMKWLLKDQGDLAGDMNAQSSITKLKQLKTDSITVTNEDERGIREQALKAIDEKKEELIQECTLQMIYIQEKVNEKKEEINQEGTLKMKYIEDKSDEKKEEIKQEGTLQMIHIQDKTDEKIEEINQEGTLQVTDIKQKADEMKKEVKQERILQLKNIEEKADEKKEEIKQEGMLQMTHIQDKADEKKEEIKQEGTLQTTHIHEKANEKKEEINQEGTLQVTDITQKADEMKKEIKQEGILQLKNIEEKADEKKQEIEQDGAFQLAHIQEKADEKKEEIKQEGTLQMKNIEDKAEEKTNEFIEKLNANTAFVQRNEQRAYTDAKSAYADAKRDMQTELMNLYKENYIKESIFPHRPEEEDTDINEIYVEPHMELVDLQSKLKTDKIGNKTIDSYKDIFYTDSNLCKRIYFAGKAGMGKTTFCKRLISSWCNAHSKLPTSQVCNVEKCLTKNTSDSHTEVTKFIDNGTDTLIGNKHIMLNFAFLFYVSLRHAGPDSEIEDMIKNQLLLQKEHTSLLTDILEKEPEQCLIILDGLDEWSPPEGHHQSLPYVTKELPARSTTFRCSILTTTRPWKLDVLKLRTPEIDKQVECLGIDNAAADKCIKYVIAILNKRRGQIRNPKDFVEELKIRNLNDIKSVPLLLKQLICLWHAGKSFGNSKCTLYSGMINLMFELAETHRLQDSIELSKIKEKSQNLHLCLPKCFYGVKLCHEFRSLIYSLSDLSLKTLMKKNEESTLVFDSSVVEIYSLSKYEIDICLKVGILSQSKVISAECTRQKSFSFIHKTFQEFFAATFISMSSDSSDEFVKTICSKINTVDDVLQQSEFLVFVSGMCPKILYKLTEHICKVAYSVTTEFRQTISVKSVDINIKTPTRQISELMTQCLLESINNGYKNISIKMEDLFFNDFSLSPISYNHVIESLTPVHIKSVNIDIDIISDTLMETLLENISHTKCLQKAVFISYHWTPCAFVCILEHSKDTLCSLSIRRHISSKMLTTLKDLKNLISLGLNNCNLSHDDLTYLYNYVTNTTQLQYISLEFIDCIYIYKFNSHCKTQQETNLDLSNHRQLIGLGLRKLSHVSTVAVNTSKLQICNIEMKYVECIKDAPNLYCLDCNNFESTTMSQSLVITLPTLIQLKRVIIFDVDFGDNELHLSADMKNLENVCLISCTMTSKALRGFVDSIPHTKLRVDFGCLGITPSSENNRCLEYIMSCPRFKVIYITNESKFEKTAAINVWFVTVTMSKVSE